MPLRILAIVFLTVSVVTGFLRFGDAGFQDSIAATSVFLLSTTAFLAVLLRILSIHVLNIGESMSNDTQTRSD